MLKYMVTTSANLPQIPPQSSIQCAVEIVESHRTVTAKLETSGILLCNRSPTSYRNWLWLTCWSWPGSASPWRWEWACGTWVRPGIPALGWTGRETWWPGTWSEGRGRKWWGCQPDPLFLAPRISLSTRRRLPLAPGEICWNQKVILLPTVREKNTAAIRSPARSGN